MIWNGDFINNDTKKNRILSLKLILQVTLICEERRTEGRTNLNEIKWKQLTSTA